MVKREKHRASRTHGRGKKAGRGAGKRGGRGNAGLHKHKYITTVKYDPKHFGRYGFKRPPLTYEKDIKVINISQLEDRLGNFLEKGYAKEQENTITLDLTQAGYDKLLGSGSIKRPFHIKIGYATQRAISKVESVGGIVVSESEDATEETREDE
jgi:large subunit ribosomal protein L15